jgi:hypothetical protein
MGIDHDNVRTKNNCSNAWKIWFTSNTDPIGEGPYSDNLGKTIPYYDKLVSMLKIGRYGPNIPEQPQIAEHIRQALNIFK